MKTTLGKKERKRKNTKYGTESITCDVGDGLGDVYHDVDTTDYRYHVIPCQYCEARKKI